VAIFVGPRLVDKIPTQQYFFFCWTGFSIWFFFSQSIQASCFTLNQKIKLLRSSQVPKSYLAVSPVIAGLLELGFNLMLIFMVAILVWGPAFSFKTPLFMLHAFFITILFSLGVSLWVSSLCLLFQDVKYLISFLLQLGFLCSPVIYAPRISGLKALLYYSNPLALSMKLFRNGLGIHMEITVFEVLGGTLIPLIIFLTGYFFFCSKSDKFAELV
jgi:ABC-type polysaccharide/polyol phosphate export permease